MSTRQPAKDETLAARAGHARPAVASTPASMPIYQAAVFEFSDLDEVKAIQTGRSEGFVYSRISNPTVWAFEQDMCALEHGDVAFATASGMGAIFAATAGIVGQGDHVVLAEQLYGATYALMEQMLSRFGISTTYVDARNPGAIEAALTPHTKLCYIETISNPLLHVTDVKAVAAICRPRGIAVVVDNTFATPLGCKPLVEGADIVVHSATKYLGGHSDVTAGVVVAKQPWAKKLRSAIILAGATLDPHAAWLLLRGLKTLAVRFQRQAQNATEIASRLSQHPAIASVHACHHPACAVVSFETKADANALLKALPHLPITPSLGGTMTTMAHPASMSHSMLPASERERLGITERLLRLSAGIEHVDDVWAELDAALNGLHYS